MKIQDYLNKPYTTTVRSVTDESGTYWVASILEFEGCYTTGETRQEALENITEAEEGWLEARIANKLPIPEPSGIETEYSGKFNVRIPKELHRKLAMQAKLQNVSLNQYVLYKLGM